MSDEGVTTAGSPEVRVSTSSGSIRVIAEHRDGVAVEGGKVNVDGPSTSVVSKGSSSLVVRCPEGADLVIGTRSGSLELRGPVGAVRFTTLSGSLRAEHVSSADIRGMSGSVDIAKCDGMCRVKTKSGSTHVGSAGAVEVTIGGRERNRGHRRGRRRTRRGRDDVGLHHHHGAARLPSPRAGEEPLEIHRHRRPCR